MFTSVFVHLKRNPVTNHTELLGTDAEFLRILETRFDISLTFQDHMDLTPITVESNRFDMLAVGCFIRHFGVFEHRIRFSTATGIDRLCCVVPKAKRYPTTLLPLLVFHPVVWIALLGLCLISGSCWMLIHRVKQRRRLRPGLIKYTLLALQTMFGEPLSRPPVLHAERILVFTLFMCSIVLVTEFVTFLTIICFSPIYYDDISSVADLLASNLPIWVQTEFYKNDIFNEQLKNRIEYVNTSDWIPRSIGEGTRQLATIEREKFFHLDLQPWAMSQKLQFVDECLRTYFVAFLFRRECKACENVNRLVGQLLSGGLMDKWTRDMLYNKTMEDWPIYLAMERERRGHEYFRLPDMLFAFIALVLGHAVSLVVFVAELGSRRTLSVHQNCGPHRQEPPANDVRSIRPFVN